MKTEPRIIAFDVDGTLLDFTNSFIRFMAFKGVVTDRRSEHVTRHSLMIQDLFPDYKDYDFNSLIHEFSTHDEFMLMPAYSGVVEAIAELRAAYPQTSLIAVSSVDPGSVIAARRTEQLKPFGLDDFIPAGLHATKAPLLQKLGVDVLFDDYEGQTIAAHEAGVHGILVDQPWNRHHETPHRLTCWSKAAELISQRQICCTAP